MALIRPRTRTPSHERTPGPRHYFAAGSAGSEASAVPGVSQFEPEELRRRNLASKFRCKTRSSST